LGSTNVKAAIYTPEGRAVALATRPAVTHYPKPTWAYYEPEELWALAVQVLCEVTAQIDDPRRIAGISVASMGEAGVPLDNDGNPTYHTIAWFDRRTIRQAEWLREAIGEDELFAITGISLQAIFSLCKLLWIKEHEPDAFRRTVRWLNVADYIAFKLSGEAATDWSLASRSLSFDIRKRTWDDGILSAAGVPISKMAPTVASGTKIGEVTREAAAATGLPTGASVSAGGHDHVCGALAAGVVRRGQMLDSMGTAEGLLFALDEPIFDPELGRQGYAQGAHVAPGKYYCFGGIYTSGASVDWARQAIGVDVELNRLLDEAEATPVGSLGVGFIPHLRLADSPHSDPRARAAFVGLTTDVTRGAMMRAVLEGLAYEARASIEPLIEFYRLDGMPEISVTGGSSKNDLLLRVKASVLNRSMRIVDLEEATALGAAILGGIGAGIYQDVDHALRTVQARPQSVEPNPADVAFYERYFSDVFQHIYQALRPLNHGIHALMSGETEPGA
jgi:xylulokinase